MKTLRRVKLLAVSVFIILGMSSCLKKSDPDFALGMRYAYILQKGSGSMVEYYPAIQLTSNMVMKSASCKFENKKFYFEQVDGMGGYLMELTSSMNIGVDTIENWTCTINATSATEQPEGATLQFTFAEVKTLGNFKVKELKYTASDNKITAKWNKVTNATDYYLVIKQKPSKMWTPVAKFSPSGDGDDLTGTINLTSTEKGTIYYLAIAAINKSVWNVEGACSIVGGEDGGLIGN